MQLFITSPPNASVEERGVAFHRECDAALDAKMAQPREIMAFLGIVGAGRARDAQSMVIKIVSTLENC